MKIHSLSDIPAWLFYPLKTWTDSSYNHYNLFLSLIMIEVLFALGAWWYLYKKIGKSDERTDRIYLRATMLCFVVVIACESIFPTEYLLKQFEALKYGIGMLAADIYLFVVYRRSN
ncbi:hypothetical protein [Lentilactobacillus kefiri]|uniref:Uncharacterized protein n=2 Tax=Lentilactobacillus kefiri TaxID=33962 RepID=A0A511DWG4_LENKE|nr:hypothetical protein [Lentilactobacillus kefiri]KRL73127.1 hypothetical protein FD08_GL002869 [Lentilactobacillus parakefiri DSM 10551]MCJ2162655.1 DUF2178 domain-containing protein [Lentilactobacillus kefiri]MCP9369818.1 DUF2178 domain-containing protein [Lentilactobacillus kefiri]MDH5109306.1 DUF2178 domain-containing protein [Lentilactobacillus kefiri]MDM7493769.1 DUF2178 domain-containing protein [Lentilactobacillus kefiri]